MHFPADAFLVFEVTEFRRVHKWKQTASYSTSQTIVNPVIKDFGLRLQVPLNIQ